MRAKDCTFRRTSFGILTPRALRRTAWDARRRGCSTRGTAFSRSAPGTACAAPSAPLMAFEQDGERDYLLVKALPGQNACRCMDDPAWLSGVLGESVRALHETDARDCPLRDGNRRALEAYEREMGAPYAGDASILRTDALIMGDCCLPNIFFDGRRFVGFIDLGDAGLGDRHFDLCWVLWSLRYNLGDGRYNGRLLDAYGRDIVDDERLRLCTELSLQKELL